MLQNVTMRHIVDGSSAPAECGKLSSAKSREASDGLLPLPPLLLLEARVALHEQEFGSSSSGVEGFGEERFRAAFCEAERTGERRQHRAEVGLVGAAGGNPRHRDQARADHHVQRRAHGRVDEFARLDPLAMWTGMYL